MDLNYILLALLLILASGVCIYVILFLRNVTKTLIKVEDEIARITEKVHPILDDLKVTSSNLARITNETTEQLTTLNSFLDIIKNKVQNFSIFKSAFFSNMPAFGFIKNITGIIRGVRAFVEKLFVK